MRGWEVFEDSIPAPEPQSKPKQKGKWELARFEQFEDARSFAIEHGWRRNEVQMRVEATGFDHSLFYVIEPYEGPCGCRNIIKPF